ncbi:MAG: hypothetical protein IKQ27_11660 [Lachnospiraceae bacterium]|nr:hypothetical protein [Lachnospiraceae bacterium]
MDEMHGPLIELSYGTSSHGMMAGTGSGASSSVEWKKDGTVIYRSSSMSSYGQTSSEYKVKPEVAQKLRDFVAEKHLAELTKEDIPLPMACDNFTSASISMTFDDSSIGGDPYESCFLNCGMAGGTFGSLEKKVKELLDECRETGEFISGEDTGNGFPNLIAGKEGMSFFEMAKSMYDPSGGMKQEPDHKPQEQRSVKKKAPGPQWTCACGETMNTGKFCINCGQSRPADPTIWTCRCGTENKGNFCAGCGSRKPE